MNLKFWRGCLGTERRGIVRGCSVPGSLRNGFPSWTVVELAKEEVLQGLSESPSRGVRQESEEDVACKRNRDRSSKPLEEIPS